MERRNFFKLVGMTSGAALTGACGKPGQELIPLLVPEKQIVPGVEEWHPSVCRECSAGCGTIVRVMEAEREIDSYRLTPSEMRVAGGFGELGDVPLIVITHGIPFTGGQAKLEEGWTAAQQRLASLSSNSELLVAEQSGHAIMWDEPDLVIDAVRRLVASAGNHE